MSAQISCCVSTISVCGSARNDGAGAILGTAISSDHFVFPAKVVTSGRFAFLGWSSDQRDDLQPCDSRVSAGHARGWSWLDVASGTPSRVGWCARAGTGWVRLGGCQSHCEHPWPLGDRGTRSTDPLLRQRAVAGHDRDEIVVFDQTHAPLISRSSRVVPVSDDLIGVAQLSATGSSGTRSIEYEDRRMLGMWQSSLRALNQVWW